MRPFLRLAAVAVASLAGAPLANAQVTVTVSDTVIAPRTRIGIGVNRGSWYNLVTANLTTNPCFESPANASGFSDAGGWQWESGGGTFTASVDTTTFVSGKQSQKLVVTGAPASMHQGEVALPQLPLVMQVVPTGSYVIKAQLKASTAGARVRFGVMAGGWSPTYGPPVTIGTTWASYSWIYVPTSAQALVGFAIELDDNTTYWVDDFIAYNQNDVDPDTGLSSVYVSRLKDLKPATLRLGGLGVNGIPLEQYLFKPWGLDYGPPPLEPEMDLDTFLRLCQAVGADPYLVVPPAFSDAAHAALGDLTDDVVDNWYADHGNLVDYLGGDGATTYGARREATGRARWDLAFGSIYLELGNELWGTPDGKWDMNVGGSDSLLTQMQRFVRYNQKRMTEMKGRPGWRANMRVGFCGRSPDIWIGNWPGSYDVTVVPALASLTDMSTIGMYYGPESSSTSDDALYGDLFAQSVWFGRNTTALKAAFRKAAGDKDLETTVYEGNAVWGPYNAAADMTTYGKEVSLGAAVSLVDHFAAANQAGVTVNNLFHFNGNVWAIVTNYPNLYRKPAFWAAKLFTTEITGDLVTCTVQGAGTYTSAIAGEPPTPIVACYAYKDGGRYQVLLVNRSRSAAQSVTVARSLAPAKLVKLTGSSINATNENGEAVTLTTQTLASGATSAYVVSVPPYSAVMLVGDDTTGTAPSAVTASASADGQVGVALTPVTFTTAGTAPITWSVSTGSIPPGLSLSATTGVLSGTPTTAGAYDFTVTATNAYGNAGTPVHVVIAPAGGGTGPDPGTDPGTSGGTAGSQKLSPAVGGCAAAPPGGVVVMMALGALALLRRRRF